MGKNGTQPTTKNVTPAVTPWGKNRVKNTETGKHVLIMPGIGYTVDRPLLYCCLLYTSDAADELRSV